jgi:hypothetical protein
VVAEEEHFAPVVLGELADRLAAPEDLAIGGGRQAGEDAQQAGLAGAVLALHVQPFARADREIEPGEQAAFAANTGKAGGGQHGGRILPESAEIGLSAVKHGRRGDPRHRESRRWRHGGGSQRHPPPGSMEAHGGGYIFGRK